MEDKKLIQKAKEASNNSYSPYSKFKVGASLLTKSGNVYLGTNIENSSFGATCCAERVAIFNAITCGEKEFEAICIYSENALPYPCGICRQVLSEFSENIKIIVADSKKYEIYYLSELLKNAFNFK